MSNINLLICYS